MKALRRRIAASPVASARLNEPERANPHPKIGMRSVSSLKVPVLRRTETPGVVFAIAKAISHPARTADGTAGGLVTFVWEVARLEVITSSVEQTNARSWYRMRISSGGIRLIERHMLGA